MRCKWSDKLAYHLISKLRHDSALYFGYEGPYSGRGPRKKYGDKLNYQDIPEEHLKTSSLDKDIETKIYQMQMWHKKFADLLNVVVVLKTNIKSNKSAHVVLFSSDLELSYEFIIDYYRLRFQIEFNFRDAKQHWGLEDFMVVNERSVYNSANLAMFMVNVFACLNATDALTVARVECERSQNLVSKPEICGGNIKITSGNARVGFY